MMRGRKPKTRQQHLINGNPGKRPLPPIDPSKKTLGNPPPEIKGLQRKQWFWIRRECPWLRRADRKVVEVFCSAWEEMHISFEKWKDLMGISVADMSDEQLKQLTLVQRSALTSRNTCINVLAELGATATSRTRVQQLSGWGKKKNPADRFFGPS